MTGPAQSPSPHHYLGLHNIPDDGGAFEQLTRAIAEYATTNGYPSVDQATSSTITRGVRPLQVNKDLPPLPSEDPRLSSEDGPLSPEDESSGRYPPLHPPHEPPSQTFRAASRPSINTTLSINPPPSLGSRISAPSGAETCPSIPNSNFGTSTSGSVANFSATIAVSQCYSPSNGQAAQLLTDAEEQRWSDAEPELTNLTSPPSPLLQNAPHNHILLGENAPIEPSSPLHISHLVSEDSDPSDSEKSPIVEKPLTPREALFVLSGDCLSPDSEMSPAIEWKPLIPTPPTTPPPKSDRRGSRKRTLSGVSRSVPRLPPELQARPPPKHPLWSKSTARKRQKTEGHSHPLSSTDLISFSPDLRDYSNERRSPDHLPRASLWSSGDERSSSLSPQSVYNSSIASAPSLPEECVYPLSLTLEKLFKGGTDYYRITTCLLSGEPKIQEVQIDIKPGWRTGTRIIFPDAGNERYPGVFQTIVFVVQQVDHKMFTRREDGNLEYEQYISPLDVRNTNGTRPLRKVVGLDGNVIEFYPPRGAIWDGQETVIKGEGMHKRSKGKVVGRGDLIVRWNITP